MAQEPAARPNTEDRIRAALWFAERGFGVFSVWSTDPDGTCRCKLRARCESPGKHPVPANGFKSATTDPVRIRAMLSAGSDPNWGMLPPEGVFALDVDGEGPRILGELEGRYGSLPPTLRTATAHGQHVFLRWPETFPRPVGQLFGFVTRWGSGPTAGYVIGPRSVHSSGAEYAPLGDCFDVAELPDAWAHAALEVREPEPSITIRGPQQITVGHRHEYLRNQARHLVGLGLAGDDLYNAVAALNRQLAEPKSEEAVRRAIGEAETKFAPDPVDPDTGERIPERRRRERRTAPAKIIDGLPFYTAAQVKAMTPDTIEWAWRDYLAFGTVVEIVGPPKAGKTTLVFSLVRAMTAGLPFLERVTCPGPVVVLTEQGSTSLRAVLERTGIADRDDVVLLFHRDARSHEWPDIVATAVARCEELGARVLVVDTLPAFAGLTGDAENDAGAALEAMEPLLAASGAGYAVLVNRHRRKAWEGGDIADEGRGSGAFSGAVDVILALRRKPGAGRPTIRVLAAASRFDETPEELLVELEEDRYVVLGDDAAVESAEARNQILDILAAQTDVGIGQQTGITLSELIERTSKSRTTLQRVLEDLIRTRDVARIVPSARSKPYRYLLADAQGIVVAQSVTPYGGEPSDRSGNARYPLPAEPTVRCSDFTNHQTRHRRLHDGTYVCPVCHPDDPEDLSA